jgi:lysophospholipase L1-like esterase
MKPGIFILLVTLVFSNASIAQSSREYKTWNPATDTLKVLEGQGWRREGNNFYNRLPAKSEHLVGADIWNLSKNGAGLLLRFRTNADEIIIKFTVTGGLQMFHMPATGVSGVDLYSKTIDGKWVWAAGKYAFDDTIVYRFTNLLSADQHVGNREYTLYLPLFNSVKWMEVAVPKESFFTALPARNDQPIVVYGTSIAQGACASRPGLAWSSILGRKLDRPVINLGFSGNGHLDKTVIELMTEVEAKIYVLDCFPNMVAGKFTANELKKRIVDALSIFEVKRPGIPVLLTDHDGYTDEGINAVGKKNYQDANMAFKEVFDSLIAAGTKNIYRLSKEAINQDIESMVDGIHPNDIGMMHYAEAYEKKIREILNEPVGMLSTMIPITQRRDFNVYDWEPRHNAILKHNKEHPPKVLLIGNSITHFWGGKPQGPRDAGIDSWNKYFGKKEVINMGFGWDRIENVLWRVYHGELGSIAPKQVVLMIGTNNLQLNTNEEILQGLQFLIRAIMVKQTRADILMMGIFPRRDMEARIVVLNKMIEKNITGSKIRFADAGPLLLKKNKKIDEAMFSDGLHPNAAGYEKLGAFIDLQLTKMEP